VGELRNVGIAVAKSTVVKYRPQVRKPPSPTWKAFLANHVQDLVALGFFTVSTVTFKVLFVLVILAHERRQVGHVNVTEQIFFLQGHDDLLLVTLKPVSEHGKEKLKES
jgi:putative transposase